jgi:hypothetical protein
MLHFVLSSLAEPSEGSELNPLRAQPHRYQQGQSRAWTNGKHSRSHSQLGRGWWAARGKGVSGDTSTGKWQRSN